MRCGKECQENDVFCPECLEYMKENPVNPGIPIQLPVRRVVPPYKMKQRELSPEEQIEALRYSVLMRGRWILVLLLLLSITAALLVLVLFFPELRNYLLLLN